MVERCYFSLAKLVNYKRNLLLNKLLFSVGSGSDQPSWWVSPQAWAGQPGDRQDSTLHIQGHCTHIYCQGEYTGRGGDIKGR